MKQSFILAIQIVWQQLIIKMRKWKILNDSDRQSQHSRQLQKQQKSQNNQASEVKQGHKAYIPLRRKKTNNSSTLLSNSKNLSNSNQFFIPSLSHKYIRYDGGGTAEKFKMKTQTFMEDDTIMCLPSLEDIQQKSYGLGGTSERAGSVQLKRSADRSKFISQRQTQRTFFRQPSGKPLETKQKQQIDSAFKKKQKVPNIGNLQQAIHNVSKEHKLLLQQVKANLQQYTYEFKQSKLELTKRITDETVSRVHAKEKQIKCLKTIEDILGQYREYKPKIDELESQKQVFLQALIRMAPV